MHTPTAEPQKAQGFRHEALLYDGQRAFVEFASAFVADAVELGEPTLVAVREHKLAALRERFAGSDLVAFADMGEMGANPARIIPAWREFADAHGDRPLRGIGEPVWPGRSAAELVEAQRHESLLNLAFAGAPAFWLVCPYDTGTLEPQVIDEARRSHPLLQAGDGRGDSAAYQGVAALANPFDDPLPEPPAETVARLPFGPGQLDDVRTFVAGRAAAAGLDRDRSSDLVLAVNEVATNSLLYGGAQGVVRAWPDGDVLICEVRDGGVIHDPLVGRHTPGLAQHGGRGLWMANQLCDLVQLRSSDAGTVVRVHMRRA
ncbi:MAG TPA: sensor histidine kinase [Euzebyales bacterium]|nr:sensor histidine kinase [Euzebyales bacterium]